MSENRSTFEHQAEIYIGIISRRWKLLAAIIFGITILSAAASMLLTKYYRSTAMLLPQTEDMQNSTFSNLAALAGAAMGKTPPEMLYPTIIESEEVLGKIVTMRFKPGLDADSTDLIHFWKYTDDNQEKNFKDAVTRLQDELDVNVDKRTNVVSISLLMPDPKLAADVVNAVITELDRFMRTKRTSSAVEKRNWIQTRLIEKKTELEIAENRLKEFRERNRIAASPQLLLDEARLEREVEIGSAVYEELTRQYEIARIEEVKNTVVVNVMDKATPAVDREKPKRRFIVLTAFFISCLIAAGTVYVLEVHGEVLRLISSKLRFFKKRL